MNGLGPSWDNMTAEQRAVFVNQLKQPHKELDRTITSTIHFNLTDAGNGELFAWLFGDRYRFDHARRRDLLFETHRWRQDANDKLILMAKDAARYRYQFAGLIENRDERGRAARWAIQSEGRARID